MAARAAGRDPDPAVHAQFDTNSTPNHLLLVGGQTPTLRNPPRSQAQPVWDMPSILGHADDHGFSEHRAQ